MDRAEIIEHLRQSLTVILGRPLPEFGEETRILEDLEMDSMRFVELLMSLEDTLGLEADPETLDPEVFQSAGSFAAYIKDRLDLTRA
ncbi:phosphopantetheine-binding protein [Streptomyces sp. NPDC006997]|uniref:acyl carrier protein n=1 Tax=Streptomyces sp. NPDC006997 TaxID=3155356 RepID=UPI0033C29AD6